MTASAANIMRRGGMKASTKSKIQMFGVWCGIGYIVLILVGWALVGRPLDDAGMLTVLASYAPHRHRVVRLVEMSGARKPRFAPRYAPRYCSGRGSAWTRS